MGNNPIRRVMGLFMGKMAGGTFENGLTKDDGASVTFNIGG